MAVPTGYAYKLRTVQVGKETTWGTSVAATARLNELIEAEFTANVQVEEYVSLGTLSPATSADVVYADGKISLQGRLTLEDAPFLQQALCVVATPAGAGPYIRTYLNPHNQSYNPASYTIEYGIVGSNALYKATGAVLVSLELSLKKRDVWMYKAEFVCKSVTTLGSLTALTDRATNRIRARDLVLSLDPLTNAPGTTPVTGFVRDLKINIKTNVHLKDFVGDLNPVGFGIDQWEASLELKVELVAATKTEVDAIIGANLVERFLRFKSTRGTQIDQFDWAGYWDGSGQKLFEDNDGNVGIALKSKPIYNIAQGWWMQWTNTNSIAVLPF